MSEAHNAHSLTGSPGFPVVKSRGISFWRLVTSLVAPIHSSFHFQVFTTNRALHGKSKPLYDYANRWKADSGGSRSGVNKGVVLPKGFEEVNTGELLI